VINATLEISIVQEAIVVEIGSECMEHMAFASLKMFPFTAVNADYVECLRLVSVATDVCSECVEAMELASKSNNFSACHVRLLNV